MARRTNTAHTYALEMTAVFVSGLGMMLLVLVSVWVAALVITGSNSLSNESIGSLAVVDEDSERFAVLSAAELSAGQVAGVVDEVSITETDARNVASQWLSEVRQVQSLNPAYRDGVLDRGAQNHARLLASTCQDDLYTSWDEALNTRVDEGFISTYSEAVFLIPSTDFARELPDSPTDYSRLFTEYEAYGVGLAEVPESSSCQAEFVLSFHLATVR